MEIYISYSSTLLLLPIHSEQKGIPDILPMKTNGKTTRQKSLLGLAEKRVYIIRKNVGNVLKTSWVAAMLIPWKMVEDGLLEKEGSGRQLKY